MDKLELVFNDPRSPIISAVQTIVQYKGDKGVAPFHKMFRDLEDFMSQEIDMESLVREQRQLEALNDEIARSQTTMKSINSYLLKAQIDLNTEQKTLTEAQT